MTGTTPISITVADEAVLQALQSLTHAMGDLSAPLGVIGENLAESAKQRFHDSVGPDGTPWAANTETTYLAYLRLISGVFDKGTGKRSGDKGGFFDQHGHVAARSIGALIQKKPLLGETRLLSTLIYHDIVGGMELHVGSPQVYAAMQQFGGKKADYPWLWGDIPPRPFLGVSAADREMILEVLAGFLSHAV